MLAGLEINRDYTILAKIVDNHPQIIHQEKTKSLSEISFSNKLLESISAETISALSVNILPYWGLRKRSSIRHQLEKLVPKINLIPSPLAAVLSNMRLQASKPLDGDILWIKQYNNIIEYAFISIFSAKREITLESHQIGNTADLLGTANRLGFYQQGKFTVNTILYSDFHLVANKQYYYNFFGNTPIVSTRNDEIISGLSFGEQMMQDYSWQLKIIYPFSFYIEKFNKLSGQKKWYKIPFDNLNLELDINHNYKLFTFHQHNSDFIAQYSNNEQIVIWESSSNEPIISATKNLLDHKPLLEYCPPLYINYPLDLYVDFQRGILRLQQHTYYNYSSSPVLNENKFWIELNERHEKQGSLLHYLQYMSPELQQDIKLSSDLELLSTSNKQLMKENLLNKLCVLKYLYDM